MFGKGVGGMARCQGVKADHTPCERIIGASQRFCYSHDPSNADARKRTASKAGKVKTTSAEIREAKQQLRTLADDVIEGRVDKGRASVAAQVLGVLQKWVEQERKIKETDELAKRVQELEEQQAQNMGGWSREYGW